MSKIRFKLVLLVAFALGIVACKNDNATTLKHQAEKPSLPKIVNIVPVDGNLLSFRAASDDTTDPVLKVGSKIHFEGHLKNVEMNHNPPKHKEEVEKKIVEVDIVPNSDGTVNFFMRPFRVGSMPAHLRIDINKLPIQTTGHFDETLSSAYSILHNALHLVFIGDPHYGGIPYNVTLIKGDLRQIGDRYKLSLTLKSSGSIFNIEVFDAHVEYDSIPK